MDIERLTPSQVVLLTLLVSFVSAVASGIVTVTLLDQQPTKVVPQVVQKVVERTVERVAPAPTPSAPPERVVEKTVVVREEELVPQAVAAAQRGMVRIFRLMPASPTGEDTEQPVDTEMPTTTTPTTPSATHGTSLSHSHAEGASSMAEDSLVRRFVGHGVAVGEGWFLAPDRIALPQARYLLAGPTGEGEAEVAVESVGPFALFRLKGTSTIGATPLKHLDPASLKLGQGVVVVGGEERLEIATTIISFLPELPEGVASSTPLRTLFPIVGLQGAPQNVPGAVAVSLFGELVALFDGSRYRVITPSGLERLMNAARERTDTDTNKPE